MNSFKLSCVLLGMTVLFAGCSSTQSKAPINNDSVAPIAAPTPTATPKPTSQSVVKSVQLPAYLDPNNPISKDRSVYFDFDAYSIKSDYSSLLERHGKYLASNPGIAIKVEGNTDERGSAEYNLALGHKRAQAVVGALKLLGVKESQMEAVSWGMEKPRAPGHDEAAWAENRRADLVYPKQ